MYCLSLLILFSFIFEFYKINTWRNEIHINKYRNISGKPNKWNAWTVKFIILYIMYM